MAKTENELQELKERFEALNRELAELTEEELAKVAGGCYAVLAQRYGTK